MGLLAWAATTTAKQAVLMAVLAALPGMWWTYSVGSPRPTRFTSSANVFPHFAVRPFRPRLAVWGAGASGAQAGVWPLRRESAQ